MIRKLVILVIILLVIASAVVVVKKKQRELAALPKPQPVVPTIRAARAVKGIVEVTRHYLGTVEPYSKADLSARISGTILSIDKREGDRVLAGEQLVTLDDRELGQRAAAAQAELLATRQKLAGAKSALATQQAIHERDVVLAKNGAIPQEEMERSRAAADGARSVVDSLVETLSGLEQNIAALRTQEGYARLSAPFDGVVTKRWNDQGDLAVPGKPILSLEKISLYKVLAQAPQEELAGIAGGSVVYLRAGGQTAKAAVHQVYPALGRNLQATIEVLVDSTPFGLPSGATVGFDVVTKRVEGLVVPETALVQSSRGSFVCQIQDGVIRIQAVQVLGMGDGKAVIAGSLAPGNQVAVGQENRLLSLAAGSAVQVVEVPQ